MAQASLPRGFRPGDLLLVVHDFAARGDDELTLRRGEKIELVELDDGFGDGWYLGKDVQTGVTGLFPGVYTTKAPNIPLRPRTDDDLASSSSAPRPHEGEGTTADREGPLETRDLVATPKSEDTTPHASRHGSLTDLRGAQGPNQTGPALLVPKQQQQQTRSTSSPLPTATMAADIQHSIRQSLDPHMNGQDSPVMNETLSVIDEHITDLSTPRHSVKPAADQKTLNDSASEYSSHLDHRMSYINGQETDEEEGNQHSEEQVRKWGVEETVKHLRVLGLDEKHCEIFEEQEITGDVLLDMNQDFIMMKEFDFGVMGRRLKTWHKIKAFQEETKGYKEQQSPTRSATRAGPTGPLRPRLPSFRGSFSSGATQHPRLVSSSMQSDTSSPSTPQTPSVPFMDHTRRPSAASIREINHQRRHSSLDATSRYSIAAGEASPRVGTHHGKKSSFDRGWTMSLAAQRASPRPGTALSSTNNTGLQHTNGLDSDDLDRGYFSGPEVDTRTQRRVLQKRASVSGSAHSLQSSLTDEQLRANRRHSRISSMESVTDTATPNSSNPDTMYPSPSKGRLRSLSSRMSTQQAPRNTGSKGSGGGFFSSFAPRAAKPDPDTARAAPQIKKATPKFRRAVGLRAMSDATSKGDDSSAAPESPASPVHETDPVSARTGSTTPSTSKSSERHSTDGSGKAGDSGISFPRPRPSIKGGVKSKKDTSAYTRGLEKKTPQEQMECCDFSGWMKKRSSNLMTTWKPRLFVLRGRRLSYYYSENDTEERGLIDITSHRVLRADNDPIVTLHATITGATVSPTSPAGSTPTGDGSVSENGSTSESLRKSRTDKEGPFFFKLIPPKSSRTVQFTKPAVHYFQVDSVKVGRLWMAALMKATIERDINLPIETTNKQRTISLKEAQLMNQRPPALMPDGQAPGEDAGTEPAAPKPEESSGLMIQGLDMEQMGFRCLLSRLLLGLLPLAVASTVYLYLYPVFKGCAYPLPQHTPDATPQSSAFLATLRQHLTPQSAPDPEPAIFRLLVLADPQLEGDSSLPRRENELGARIQRHWDDILTTIATAPSPVHGDVLKVLSAALKILVSEDLPRAFKATRKRLDLLGNDYYLAHIYRTLHWWTRPTHVTVLGDLLGSQWVTDEEFLRRGDRYWQRVFQGGKRVEDEITRTGEKGYTGNGHLELPQLEKLPSPPSWAQRIINVVGNHDIGYSGDASERRIQRFEHVFGRANWDIRFQHPPVASGDEGKPDLTPTLHVINLNSLTLDAPPYSQEVLDHSYAYLNDIISQRSYPVEDRTTFTLLLTHLPLHKREGVCTDGPYFTFFDADDESEQQRYRAGGLREQNHLSDHISTNGILQGIFGMNGDQVSTAGQGWGRNGLILTGHDHTGCDILHYIDTPPPPPPPNQDNDTLTNNEEEPAHWTWNAKRYDPSDERHLQSITPSIREITLRSMMGEYGGNAGLLSLWFDVDAAEWRYAVQMCPAGVQHIWWAVHVVDLITLGVGTVYILLRVCGSGSSTQSTPVVGGDKKTR
ncbi:hypothetical protein BJX63DRAFT_421574 [Aspergillus granulosus]|uniref:Uncharacterized protein n=1 Tax=Aspergillus granulosus TaxID=176169 RepID=A0ABR4HBL6_9EURO